ncbi:hypothetical protein ACI65C_012099 [Semiaphis heraclei]
MVLTVSLVHIFQQPFQTIKTYYSQIRQKDDVVKISELIDAHIDEHGFEYTKHRLVCHNVIPQVLRRDQILHIPEILIEEECWYDEKGQKFWARTRNLSWSEIATLSNIITLSITPNPTWTKYEIDGITDFFGTQPHGIGYAVEYFLKKYTEKKLLEHIKIIDQECLKNNDLLI